MFYAFLAGFGGPSQDGRAFGHILRGLAVSAACGVAAMACLVKVINCPMRKSLLLVGLLPAGLQVAMLLTA